MVDSKQCIMVIPHPYHGWEEREPGGRRLYHVCKGVEGKVAEPLFHSSDPAPLSTIAILATTHKSGHVYAEALGLKEYRIITDEKQGKGLRIKTFIVSPGYFRKMEQQYFEANNAFDSLMQSAAIGLSPLG